MAKEKSLVEEAILSMKNLEEAVAENAKGILASTMKEEIKELVKESLSEQEEDEIETDVDMEEPEMDDESDIEGEEEEIDEDINLEELLAAMDSDEEKETSIKEYMDDYVTPLQAIIGIGGPILTTTAAFLYFRYKEKAAEKIKAAETDAKAKAEIMSAKKEAENAVSALNLSKGVKEVKKDEANEKETEETIKELRNELNEVNLLNAKLLYTNKIFKAKNLTESEKVKVLNTFDKAETVKEVKLVFETLNEGLKVKKDTIKENIGRALKTTNTPTVKTPIVESNEAFARMRKLAGII